MQRLIRVSRGMMVSEKNDISCFVPDYTEAKNYSMTLWSNLMKLGAGCTSCVCGCDHDPYSVLTRQVPAEENPLNKLHSLSPNHGIDATKPFGGYANAVHETPGHKCYSYGNACTGYTNENGDVTLDKGPTENMVMPLPFNPVDTRMRNYIVSTLNDMTISFIVNALMAKRYYSEGLVQETTLYRTYMSVINTIASYLTEVPNSSIVGISCADVTYGVASKQVYQNTFLIHVADDANIDMDPGFRFLCNKLSSMKINVRYGKQTEIDAVLKHKSTVLNWSFGVGQTETSVDLVFSGCRAKEADQHKITMMATSHIGMSVPNNVGMMVDHIGSLEVTVTMDMDYILSVVSVNAASRNTAINITLSDGIEGRLEEFGISVYPIPSVDGMRCYQILICNIREDMTISLAARRVTSDVGLFDYNRELTTVELPGIAPEMNQMIPFTFNLKLGDNVELWNRSKVSLYVIPVDMYSMMDVPTTYRVPRTISKVSVGFGSSPILSLQGAFSSNLLNKSKSILLRVVFKEGALSINALETAYRNAKCCVQAECQCGVGTPISCCLNMMDPVRFKPTVPVSKSFVKLSEDQKSYFNLYAHDDGNYVLTVTDGDHVAVPEGLTNQMTYNVEEMYGLADGEKFYFASLLIPIAPLYANASMEIGGFFNKISLSVTSKVNAKFFMVRDNCVASDTVVEVGGVKETRSKVVYTGLSRPWLDGYIEIPVVFAAKDTIAICIPEVGRSFSISVDLDIPEDTDDGNDKLDIDGHYFPYGYTLLNDGSIMKCDLNNGEDKDTNPYVYTLYTLTENWYEGYKFAPGEEIHIPDTTSILDISMEAATWKVGLAKEGLSEPFYAVLHYTYDNPNTDGTINGHTQIGFLLDDDWRIVRYDGGLDDVNLDTVIVVETVVDTTDFSGLPKLVKVDFPEAETPEEPEVTE